MVKTEDVSPQKLHPKIKPIKLRLKTCTKHELSIGFLIGYSNYTIDSLIVVVI